MNHQEADYNQNSKKGISYETLLRLPTGVEGRQKRPVRREGRVHTLKARLHHIIGRPFLHKKWGGGHCLHREKGSLGEKREVSYRRQRKAGGFRGLVHSPTGWLTLRTRNTQDSRMSNDPFPGGTYTGGGKGVKRPSRGEGVTVGVLTSRREPVWGAYSTTRNALSIFRSGNKSLSGWVIIK